MFDIEPSSCLFPDPHRLTQTHVLSPCTIQWLGKPDAQQQCHRATITVEVGDHEDGPEVNIRFTVTAHHQQPIPENERYALLLDLVTVHGEEELQYWMAGTYTSPGAIQKISMLELEDESGLERLCQSALAVFTPDVPVV
ncbi:hypothetical protein NM688_g4872 [Phlebia brevispora]|uniref:Uncharacterized protein n=1 Tax=Phlebia brevispora TaxID=194682 RepID=A0ACC1T1V2_9APHY|nr:hypothetical protein NM688_g4872 [Phlebia brevispora]